MVEHASRAITEFMGQRGMVAAFCIFIDTIFVPEAHAAAVARWLATDGAALTLRGGMPLLSNRTSDCLDDRALRYIKERALMQDAAAASGE